MYKIVYNVNIQADLIEELLQFFNEQKKSR